MPEQELNLLQFATTLVAQSRAPATKVMRGYVRKVAGRASPLHNSPNYLRTEAVRANPSCFVDRAEDWAVCDVCLRHPGAQCRCNPEWNWDGPHVATLTRPDLRRPSALRVAADPGHSARPPRRDAIRSPTAQRSSHSLEHPAESAGRITPSKRFPCSVSQLPIRTPNFFAPLTRRVPAAKSRLSRPASAAS